MHSENDLRFKNYKLVYNPETTIKWLNENFKNEDLDRIKLYKNSKRTKHDFEIEEHRINSSENLHIKGLSLLNLIKEYNNCEFNMRQLWSEDEAKDCASITSTSSDSIFTFSDIFQNNHILKFNTVDNDVHKSDLLSKNLSDYKVFHMQHSMFDETFEDESYTDINQNAIIVYPNMKSSIYKSYREHANNEIENAYFYNNLRQHGSNSNISYSYCNGCHHTQKRPNENFYPVQFTSSDNICITHNQEEIDNSAIYNQNEHICKNCNNLSNQNYYFDGRGIEANEQLIKTFEIKSEEEIYPKDYDSPYISQNFSPDPNCYVKPQRFQNCAEHYNSDFSSSGHKRFGRSLGYKIKCFKHKSNFPPIPEQPSTDSCEPTPIPSVEQMNYRKIPSKKSVFNKFIQKCKSQIYKKTKATGKDYSCESFKEIPSEMSPNGYVCKSSYETESNKFYSRNDQHGENLKQATFYSNVNSKNQEILKNKKESKPCLKRNSTTNAYAECKIETPKKESNCALMPLLGKEGNSATYQILGGPKAGKLAISAKWLGEEDEKPDIIALLEYGKPESKESIEDNENGTKPYKFMKSVSCHNTSTSPYDDKCVRASTKSLKRLPSSTDASSTLGSFTSHGNKIKNETYFSSSSEMLTVCSCKKIQTDVWNKIHECDSLSETDSCKSLRSTRRTSRNLGYVSASTFANMMNYDNQNLKKLQTTSFTETNRINKKLMSTDVGTSRTSDFPRKIEKILNVDTSAQCTPKEYQSNVSVMYDNIPLVKSAQNMCVTKDSSLDMIKDMINQYREKKKAICGEKKKRFFFRRKKRICVCHFDSKKNLKSETSVNIKSSQLSCTEKPSHCSKKLLIKHILLGRLQKHSKSVTNMRENSNNLYKRSSTSMISCKTSGSRNVFILANKKKKKICNCSASKYHTSQHYSEYHNKICKAKLASSMKKTCVTACVGPDAAFKNKSVETITNQPKSASTLTDTKNEIYTQTDTIYPVCTKIEKQSAKTDSFTSTDSPAFQLPHRTPFKPSYYAPYKPQFKMPLKSVFEPPFDASFESFYRPSFETPYEKSFFGQPSDKPPSEPSDNKQKYKDIYPKHDLPSEVPNEALDKVVCNEDPTCKDCNELGGGLNSFFSILGCLINKKKSDHSVCEERCEQKCEEGCCPESENSYGDSTQSTAKSDAIKAFYEKLIENLIKELYSKNDNDYTALNCRINNLDNALQNTTIEPYLHLLRCQKEEQRNKKKCRQRRNKMSMCQIRQTEMSNGVQRHNIINVCDISEMHSKKIKHGRPLCFNKSCRADRNYYYDAFLPLKTSIMSRKYPPTTTHDYPNYYYAQVSTKSRPRPKVSCSLIKHTKKKKKSCVGKLDTSVNSSCSALDKEEIICATSSNASYNFTLPKKCSKLN